MENPDFLKTALELLQTGIVANATKDGAEYLVIPANALVYDLEKLRANPRRIKRSLQFARLDSFCEYVNEFKAPGTKIFMNTKSGQATAVLDYHQPSQASWAEHVAHFAPVFTESWQRWNGVNNQPMDQKKFALFVEDNALDIAQPAPAEMLDIARNLTAKLSVNFKKGIRLENGAEELHYEETIDAKAGHRGQLEIPAQFVLELPVFEGRPSRQVPVRLRYSIKEGTLSFCCSLVRLQEILQPEIDALCGEIAQETSVQPLFGSC